MYTSMLATDAAAARDGINTGLAAEYGPGAGPPGPGARLLEEAGAGAGAEVRANAAGSNTSISIITTANPLLDIAKFSFWFKAVDAAIFSDTSLRTNPRSIPCTHNVRAAM